MIKKTGKHMKRTPTKRTTARKVSKVSTSRFKRDWKLFPSLIAALAVIILGSFYITSHALSEDENAWNVRCNANHFAPDDPLVFPNQPGASHMHMFFSNKSTNAASTTDSLSAGAADCGRQMGPIDKSSYWVPALYKKNADGTTTLYSSTSTFVSAYYRRPGGSAGPQIKPFPRGLRMLAGNPKATTAQSHSIAYWQCGAGGPEFDSLPNCSNIGSSSDFVRGDIEFPSCWDGVNLDSADHRSHMAYAGPGGVCPAGHPVSLPKVTYEIWFDGLKDASNYVLSSDTGGAGLSLHGDFWAVWDNQVQNALTDGCLNAGRACIGIERSTDGRTLSILPGAPYPALTLTVANYPTASPWNITDTGGGTTTPPPTPTPTPTPADTTAPSVPGGLTIGSKTSTSISLSWNASTDNVGVTGYRIYRNGAQVGTSATRTFTNSGLSPNTSYSYTVAAVDAVGNVSGQSTAASATTPALADTTAPSIPSGLTLSARSANSLNFVWVASTDDVGVTNYRIYRGGSQVGTSTTTSFNDTNLAASTQYSYTVIAVDAAGNISGQSAPLVATTSAATTCKRTWWGHKRCPTQTITTTTMPSSTSTASMTMDPSMPMDVGTNNYQEPTVADTAPTKIFGAPVAEFKSNGVIALIAGVSILLGGWILFVNTMTGRSNLKIWK